MMRVLLSILACALLSCGAGVCYAGDSARAALPCEVCLKVSADSTRVIIARCPKDSTTLYHVRRIGKKYQIETIVFLRGKGE